MKNNVLLLSLSLLLAGTSWGSGFMREQLPPSTEVQKSSAREKIKRDQANDLDAGIRLLQRLVKDEHTSQPEDSNILDNLDALLHQVIPEAGFLKYSGQREELKRLITGQGLPLERRARFADQTRKEIASDWLDIVNGQQSVIDRIEAQRALKRMDKGMMRYETEIDLTQSTSAGSESDLEDPTSLGERASQDLFDFRDTIYALGNKITIWVEAVFEDPWAVVDNDIINPDYFPKEFSLQSSFKLWCWSIKDTLNNTESAEQGVPDSIDGDEGI